MRFARRSVIRTSAAAVVMMIGIVAVGSPAGTAVAGGPPPRRPATATAPVAAKPPRRVVFFCQASGAMIAGSAAMKRDLAKAVDGLVAAGPDQQQFDIVVFPGNPGDHAAAFKQLRPATPANKAAAKDFLDNLVIHGGQDPTPALKAAVREGPTRIEFYTDGLSNLPDKSTFPADLRRATAGGGIVADVVFVKVAADSKFADRAKDYAKIGHGTFRVIDPDKM